MSEQDNIRLAQQAYNNFKTGNIEALLNLVADDIDWQLPEVANVPFAGKRRGRAEVAEFFASVNRTQEPLQFEPREFVAQGDQVVSLGHYQWRVKDTNREFASDFAHVFTIRDGKITGFREFFDTARAAAAYQRAMIA
jgi:hypothetical protein